MQALPFINRSYAFKFAVLAALYALAVHASLYLAPTNGASIVFPAAALGLMALYFWGYELWPALMLPFLGVLLLHGHHPALATGIALGNVIESLVGAYVLHTLGFNALLTRLRDSLILIAAAVTGSLLSASIISASVYFFSPAGLAVASSIWSSLWIGHSVSLLAIAPFLLRWTVRPLFTKTSREVVEGIAVFGTIATLATLFTWTPYTSVASISVVYLLVIPLIWASLRTGPRGISLALALVALITSTGAVFGYAAEMSSNPMQLLFSVQLLIGTLSLIFLLFTSITEERKEAVQELRSHVTQLEEALLKIRTEDQAKTDFLAMLAHELRNPLAPILSSLELLQAQGATHPDAPKFITVMHSHVQTMTRLLDDLLDISRISRKKFKLQKEPVLLQTVLEQALQTVEQFIASREHKLQIELPEEPLWLEADPVRLGQVFVNLLNNAAKYTDTGGTLRIQASTQAGKLIIRVSDTGVGIPAHLRRVIFEPFSPASAMRKPGGLGVGLYLTKRLVELHQGSIAVVDEPGHQGSIFEIELPLPTQGVLPMEGTGQVRRRTAHRLAPAPHQGRPSALTILVVDDNEAAAQGLAALLTHNGHTTHLAYTGEEALVRAEELTPHVVLLDIGLPGKDGYEVAALLREAHNQSITLVALTGYGQEEDRQKAREAGFDYHLTKPVSIEDVKDVLAQLSEHH